MSRTRALEIAFHVSTHYSGQLNRRLAGLFSSVLMGGGCKEREQHSRCIKMQIPCSQKASLFSSDSILTLQGLAGRPMVYKRGHCTCLQTEQVNL